jgi:dATP/dGTP diphosphohydrolase
VCSCCLSPDESTASWGDQVRGPYNWKRGQKDFFLDAWNHAFVHLQKFKEGDTSEDHLGHLACNVAFLV